MKNKKKLALGFLPAIGLIGLFSFNVASAQGFFSGFSLFSESLSSDQIAARHQNMFQSQADILGVNVDELKDAWAEGKSMREIIQEKGISQEEVQVRIKNAKVQQMKSQLQALVEKGVITQAQADKRLQTMQNRFNDSNKEMRKMRMGHLEFGF